MEGMRQGMLHATAWGFYREHHTPLSSSDNTITPMAPCLGFRLRNSILKILPQQYSVHMDKMDSRSRK